MTWFLSVSWHKSLLKTSVMKVFGEGGGGGDGCMQGLMDEVCSVNSCVLLLLGHTCFWSIWVICGSMWSDVFIHHTGRFVSVLCGKILNVYNSMQTFWQFFFYPCHAFWCYDLYHFISFSLAWPWLGVTRSAESKTCRANFLTHFSSDQDEICMKWFTMSPIYSENYWIRASHCCMIDYVKKLNSII